MAVQKVERKKGHAWRVRWIEEDGSWGSKTFARKSDADDFDADIRRRKREGTLGFIARGETTFREFARRWWTEYVEVHLTARTRRDYRRYLDGYLLPKIGNLRLGQLNTPRIATLQADLLAEGVGRETVRKSIVALQSALQRAVEWGYVPVNPARAVRKLPQGRIRTIRPIPPEAVEKMRTQLLAEGRIRDAALVCTLAYAGLRPEEALALQWRDVGTKTLRVDKAVSEGEVTETKTRMNRTVRLLTPLRDDLQAWRVVSGANGSGADGAWVFPARDGGHWQLHDWQNWRRRVYQPLASWAGVEVPRPYWLRHSFASLLLHEQKMAHAEIAQQLGHSVQTLYGTYSHVIEELRGTTARSAERLIQAARKDAEGSAETPEPVGSAGNGASPAGSSPPSIAPKLPRSSHTLSTPASQKTKK